MYRCTECSKEYETKPYYCDDCGSDTFEEIKTENQKPEAAPEPENNIKYEEKQDFTIVKEEKKPEDILSYIIFGICLFLSIIIVFFINPKYEQKNETPKKTEAVNTNIPSLDSFWNNELPKVEKKEDNPPIIQQPAEQQPKTTVVPLKFEPLKKPEKIVNPTKQPIKQNSKQQVSQPIQNAKTQKQTAQPVKQPVKQPVSQPVKQQNTPKAQPQPKTQTQNSPTNNKTTNNIQVPVWQQTQQIQPAQPVQTAKTQPATVQKPATAASSQTLANYKNSLRNKIGHAIDFADVIGDGSCALSFKIASNGKLIERKFVKQSTNSTLNDAVYKAVMQVPAFNAPPESYKGEAMQLTIKFYNGNFEISLN